MNILNKIFRNKSGNPRFFKSEMRAIFLLILSVICYMLSSNRVGHTRIKACGENDPCTASWLCEAGTRSLKGCTVIYCREDVTSL